MHNMHYMHIVLLCASHGGCGHFQWSPSTSSSQSASQSGRQEASPAGRVGLDDDPGASQPLTGLFQPARARAGPAASGAGHLGTGMLGQPLGKSVSQSGQWKAGPAGAPMSATDEFPGSSRPARVGILTSYPGTTMEARSS